MFCLYLKAKIDHLERSIGFGPDFVGSGDTALPLPQLSVGDNTLNTEDSDTQIWLILGKEVISREGTSDRWTKFLLSILSSLLTLCVLYCNDNTICFKIKRSA
jgi:hypothetical protein